MSTQRASSPEATNESTNLGGLEAAREGRAGPRAPQVGETWASAQVTLRPRVSNGKGRGGRACGRGPGDTHSTYLVQGGGSCWAMNTQLVRMVHMMSMLKSVAQCQGKLPAGGHHQRAPPLGSTPPGQGCQVDETRAPRRHTGALPSPCQPLPFGARHLPCSTASDRDQALEFELLAESLVGPIPQGWMEGRNLPDLRGFYPRPHGSRVFGHTGGRRAFINSCSEATVLGRGRSRWQGSECPPPLLREWPRLAFESGLLPKPISPVRTQ